MNSEAEFLHQIRKGGGRAAKLAYAQWLLARGDVRGEIIQLAEQTDALADNDPNRVAAFERLHELTRNIGEYSDDARWLSDLGYGNPFKFWKSPLKGLPVPSDNVGRSDPDVPIDIDDRAAVVLRRRAAELRIELSSELITLRVHVEGVRETSFDCAIRFEVTTATADDKMFWSNGVRLAVRHKDVPIVQGIELRYLDGVVRPEKRECTRTPAFKDFLRTVSKYGSGMHFTRGETTAEWERGNTPSVPLSKPKTEIQLVIARLLDGERGLRCISRVFRVRCFRTLRNESDAFLRRYHDEHLQLIVTHVEPLAAVDREGGDARFREVCTILDGTPDMAVAALTLGFEACDDSDSTLWLDWAAKLSDDAASCLYCTANYLAIPPFVGQVPADVAGLVTSLAATSLLALDRPRSAVEIVEGFLGCTATDEQTVETLFVALDRSPLQKVESLPRDRMIATWAGALALLPERGPHRADVVRRAYQRLAL